MLANVMTRVEGGWGWGWVATKPSKNDEIIHEQSPMLTQLTVGNQGSEDWPDTSNS